MPEIKLPITRYYGSKRKLVQKIWDALIEQGLEFNSVLDIFGGTGSFSYFAKKQNKEVIYNDIFNFNHHIGRKLIEQSSNNLTIGEAINLLSPQQGILYRRTITDNFDGIYFTHEENEQIDIFVQNANLLEDENKRLSAYYILYQSCIIKRPYNLFHRNNLSMRTNYSGGGFGNKITWERTFEELFERFINELDEVTFDNGRNNSAVNFSALNCPHTADLVYIDPPYFSTSRSHTTYHAKYHFLEGLANYDEIEQNIDFAKNNREIVINKSSEFEKPQFFLEQLSQLIRQHEDSIIAISYRNKGIPEIDEIAETVRACRPNNRVEVIDLGLYGYALNKSNSSNNEFLIIATNDII
ncbi:MAG: DNA adenine methylase [Sphingobacteriaceae bacterium]|nr:DNA adenine methylase [Sphingobacteriaceae bacterium]